MAAAKKSKKSAAPAAEPTPLKVAATPVPEPRTRQILQNIQVLLSVGMFQGQNADAISEAREFVTNMLAGFPAEEPAQAPTEAANGKA